MHAELRITAEYGDQQQFIAKPRHHIGPNLIATQDALRTSGFQYYSAAATSTILAAEQIRHKALIFYFLEGYDTIVAQITAHTVAEHKRQAVRIARQACTLFAKPSVKSEITVVIYILDAEGLSMAMIDGRCIGLWRRFQEAYTERWLSRTLTPAIALGLAAAYLQETNFFHAALVGFLAAAATLPIESIAFALKADNWEWKESSNEYRL